MALVSLSAVLGAVISFFTKLEMESYNKLLEKTLNVFGVLLFLAVFSGSIFMKCFIGAVLSVAALIGFIAVRNKTPLFRWAILGIVLGFLFARHTDTAYLFSVFFAVHNFVYATVLNIPLVLKQKNFMKIRLAEQAVFLAAAVIVYFAVMPFF